jgi:quinohemoprotein amine dehydrogenase
MQNSIGALAIVVVFSAASAFAADLLYWAYGFSSTSSSQSNFWLAFRVDAAPKRGTSKPDHLKLQMMRSCLVFLAILPVLAQVPARSGNGVPVSEEGFPVADPLVISKCGGCHARDAKGNLERISWERATPEGWEEAIKRMVRLNGLKLTQEEARSIIKYLSTYHGLAPEEAGPVTYFSERRIQDETNIPNDAVRGVCANCHAFAKPLSWRRSAEDWKLLTNLHVALYPSADAAYRLGLDSAEVTWHSRVPEVPLVDEALAYLSKTAPLHTPEWAAWSERMREPKLAGRWLVTADIPGRGKYYGELEVESGGAEDEFTTNVKLTSADGKSTVVRSGRSVIYASYEWRGHSKGTSKPSSAPDDLASEMREVMSVSPDQTKAQGRWFWGAYQEFGVDVKLQRASADPMLIGLDRPALRTGSESTRVRIIADNLPAQVSPGDLDFGPGVAVRRIVSRTPGELIVEVDVASNAVPGKRNIAFRRSVLEGAFAVYDRIDYIKVIPETPLAHLGSDAHPKGYQQFEAIGYQRGADGIPHTADDVELGPVDVAWSIEEFYSSYGDNDKDFVGALSPEGLFTPASDGANPNRKYSRNNTGDVWVVATAKNEKDQRGKPLVGKSYLVVTVPLYIQFDQPEVGR